jgi:hypothetical protein
MDLMNVLAQLYGMINLKMVTAYNDGLAEAYSRVKNGCTL